MGLLGPNRTMIACIRRLIARKSIQKLLLVKIGRGNCVGKMTGNEHMKHNREIIGRLAHFSLVCSLSGPKILLVFH